MKDLALDGETFVTVPHVPSEFDDDLLERAAWVARVIADSPALVIQGTMRALWTAHEMPRTQGVAMANLFTRIGSERLLRHDGTTVEARPIKGTRRRDPDPVRTPRKTRLCCILPRWTPTLAPAETAIRRPSAGS